MPTAKPALSVSKRNDVPTGEPPKGYRFLIRGESAQSAMKDEVLDVSEGKHDPINHHSVWENHVVGESSSDLSSYPFIRPLPPAKPKRAGKQPAGRTAGRLSRVGYCRRHIMTADTFDVLVSDQPESAGDLRVLVLPLDDIPALVERAAKEFVAEDVKATNQLRYAGGLKPLIGLENHIQIPLRFMSAALRAIGIPSSKQPAGRKGKR